jgi:hypothetical protein
MLLAAHRRWDEPAPRPLALSTRVHRGRNPAPTESRATHMHLLSDEAPTPTGHAEPLLWHRRCSCTRRYSKRRSAPGEPSFNFFLDRFTFPPVPIILHIYPCTASFISCSNKLPNRIVPSHERARGGRRHALRDWL